MSYRTLRAFLPSVLLASVMTIPLAQTAPTAVNFSSQTHTTGPSPSGVISGDFNEDGQPDLAVIDSQSNSVQILRNDGGGQFSLAGQTTTGMGPIQIVAGTFNLSGHQDLAVANAGDSTLTILLGRGDGTFATESVALVTGVPRALIGVDLLHDGLTQLAVVECTSAEVSCRLNIYQSNSQSLFSLSQSIPLPAAPIFDGLIVSDDFNHDGKPDIAIATDKQVLIFTNTSSFNGIGAATVALHSTITPPNTASIAGLATGHFAANPAADLAIESFDNVNNTNFPNTDYIYLNNGFGSFFLKSKVPGARGFGHKLMVSDINGDGIQDLLLLGTSLNNGDLSYALGHGDGTFTTPQSVSSFGGGVNTSLIARDVNLDSRHDLVVTSNGPLGGPAFVDVLLNQNALTNCPPPGSATLAVKFCSASTGINSISVKASGNSRNGVKRIELWIDGHKRAQAFSDQLRAKEGVLPGKHQVTLVGVDLYDALVKQTIIVNVP